MANERARTLRRNQTDAERQLWNALRRNQLDGCKFRRQHSMGAYIVDFICLEKKLIIELDGDQHGHAVHKRHDEKRDTWLKGRGYRVIRYWNNDVYSNIEGVLLEISEYLRMPCNAPPPP
jgi:BirA family biotin operon repressor/biotin-[acetyl-CoA-carboxylase] ligase